MTAVSFDRSVGASPSVGHGGGRRFLVGLVLVSILIPASFEIAGIRFTPALLVLTILFPTLLYRLLAGQGGRLRLIDFLFFLYVAWSSLAVYMNSPDRFVTYTGQQGLVVLGGYLIGRTMILDREDFAAFVRVFIYAVIVSLPFTIFEATQNSAVIIRFIRDYTPFGTFNENLYEPRMGLYRAQWVFTHPIHYGFFCALVFMLAFVALKQRVGSVRRWFSAGLIAVACFMSVSSGPVLSLFLQSGVWASYRIASQISQKPWALLMMSGTALYLVLEVASTKSAFVAVSARLALNSGTAYYRTLIWEYGTAQVARTPIFGNGFNYWPRPHWMTASIDNFWLLMAISFGLPALVFFTAAILVALVSVNRRDFRGDADLEAMRLGWTISLIGFAMIASTVALWNEILIVLMMLFGAGQWMLRATSGSIVAGDKAAAPVRTSRYTRFPAETPDPGAVHPTFREPVARRTSRAVDYRRRAT